MVSRSESSNSAVGPSRTLAMRLTGSSMAIGRLPAGAPAADRPAAHGIPPSPGPGVVAQHPIAAGPCKLGGVKPLWTGIRQCLHKLAAARKKRFPDGARPHRSGKGLELLLAFRINNTEDDCPATAAKLLQGRLIIGAGLVEVAAMNEIHLGCLDHRHSSAPARSPNRCSNNRTADPEQRPWYGPVGHAVHTIEGGSPSFEETRERGTWHQRDRRPAPARQAPGHRGPAGSESPRLTSSRSCRVQAFRPKRLIQIRAISRLRWAADSVSTHGYPPTETTAVMDAAIPVSGFHIPTQQQRTAMNRLRAGGVIIDRNDLHGTIVPWIIPLPHARP